MFAVALQKHSSAQHTVAEKEVLKASVGHEAHVAPRCC